MKNIASAEEWPGLKEQLDNLVDQRDQRISFISNRIDCDWLILVVSISVFLAVRKSLKTN